MALEDRTLLASQLPRLVVALPDGKEAHHSLTGAEITIGRDPANRICIPDHFVSKFHAKLILSGSSISVVDLGSANKTRVNGQVVSQAVLRFGDEVQFAGVKCRLMEPEAKEARASPRGAQKPAAGPAPAVSARAPAVSPRAPVLAGPGPPLPRGARAAPPRPGRSPMFKLGLIGGGLVLFALLAALALRVMLTPPAAEDKKKESPATAPTGTPVAQTPPATTVAADPGSTVDPQPPPPTATSAQEAYGTTGSEPKTVSAYFDEALSLIEAGRLREGRANFLKILEIDPANSRVKGRLSVLEERIEKETEDHFQRGRQAFTFLRYDEAIAEWEMVLALADPSDSRYSEAQKGIQEARAKRGR